MVRHENGTAVLKGPSKPPFCFQYISSPSPVTYIVLILYIYYICQREMLHGNGTRYQGTRYHIPGITDDHSMGGMGPFVTVCCFAVWLVAVLVFEI